VSLARAALANPQVLVLDEATSNLDPGTEAEVEEAMHALMEGRTVVVIAHRLSTAERADRVAVVDDGRLVAEGERFELQAEPGRDLVLARRYDATAPSPLRLSVDGQPAAEWTPRRGRYRLAEETLRIPGGLLRRPRASLAVQVVSGQSTTFAYWAFTDR
jgi:ABC-type multidrug transport system ATPase subunit